MKKVSFVAAALILVSSFMTPVYAGEETFGDVSYDASRQFGRGLLNIVTSPAEIPCTMKTEIDDRGAAGAATGLGIGLWYTVRRILVGASEVVTFFLPAPPVLDPVCKEPAGPSLA